MLNNLFKDFSIYGDGFFQILFKAGVWDWYVSAHSLISKLSIITWLDEPYAKQYGFQDPATIFFEKLIDFHHDMLFLMIVVLIFVFYMLVSCVLNFNQWASSLPAPDVRYNAKIETIWTVVPTLILLMVVVPAFSLIYSMDDNSSQPLFSVKIAGNQWYWTYEYVFLKNENTETTSENAVTSASIPEAKSFSFPYVFPSGLDEKMIALFPRKWTAQQSISWHEKTNWTEFKAVHHMLENKLKPLSTFEEWFEWAVKFNKVLSAAPLFLKESVYSNLKDKTHHNLPNPDRELVQGMLSIYSLKSNSKDLNSWVEFKTFLDRIFAKSNIGYFRFFNAPFASFEKDENFTGLKSFCKSCQVTTTEVPSEVENTSESKLNELFALKAYSYDSTMLTEDDVYASKGSKARLLSVDKPLYLPSNTLLTISVTAYDVIHSWTVPSFGVKLDGCPGRSNTVSFSVKRDGLFYGQCSEICGVNHAFMPIEVRTYPFFEFVNLLSRWK